MILVNTKTLIKKKKDGRSLGISIDQNQNVAAFYLLKTKVCITIVEVKGFLFAKTMQQPKSTTCFNRLTVSELAEQSTQVRPTTIDEENIEISKNKSKHSV